MIEFPSIDLFDQNVKEPKMDYSVLISQLVKSGAHRVTYYEGPKLIKRATRRLHNGKILADRYGLSVTITHGRPNHRERKFIAQCKKAGENFPIRKLQFQMPPKKRSKK